MSLLKVSPDEVINEFNRRFSVNDWVRLLTLQGWKPINLNSRYPSFTRQGKCMGTSGELLTDSDTILFHNFSGNSNLPPKPNGKNTYSPAEAITYFLFNQDWKRSCKYFKERLEAISIKVEPQKGKVSGKSKPVPKAPKNHISFSDFNEALLFNDKGERLFRMSVNPKVFNKNINPETNETHRFFNKSINAWQYDYSKLINSFENRSLSARELAMAIGKGYAICCSQLKPDDQGKLLKKTEAWAGSELIAIDIDGGQTIEDCLKNEHTKYALLIYTTPSHTPESQRFRIIIHLPCYVTDNVRYKKTIDKFVKDYNGDKQASSIVNAFYGNSNAWIYLIQTKEVLEFQNGKLIEKVEEPQPQEKEALIAAPVAPVAESSSESIYSVTPAIETSPDDWYEITYHNDKVEYVRGSSRNHVQSMFRRCGIFLKAIRKINYNEQTHLITYPDQKAS